MSGDLQLEYVCECVRDDYVHDYWSSIWNEARWLAIHVILAISTFFMHNGFRTPKEPQTSNYWFYPPKQRGGDVEFPCWEGAFFAVFVVLCAIHICQLVNMVVMERYYHRAFEPWRCNVPTSAFKTDAEPGVKASINVARLFLEVVKTLGVPATVICVAITLGAFDLLEARWVLLIFWNFVREILSFVYSVHQNSDDLLNIRMQNFRTYWIVGVLAWFFLNQLKILYVRPIWFMHFGVFYVIYDVYYVYEPMEFTDVHQSTAFLVVATTLFATWFHRSFFEIDPEAAVRIMYPKETNATEIKNRVKSNMKGTNPRFPKFSKIFKLFMMFTHIDVLIFLTCIVVVYHDYVAYAFISKPR